MMTFNIRESKFNVSNLLYLQTNLSELFKTENCKASLSEDADRATLKIEIVDYYADIIMEEIKDRVAEIITVKYKYNYLSDKIRLTGLSENEMKILFTSLISADLDDDKRYVINQLKNEKEIAIDGFFNFRLKALKEKWQGITGYLPAYFSNDKLKDFIGYLTENRNKKILVDNGKVFDSNFRRLKRSSLLKGEKLSLVCEILLSSPGEIEINGDIPKEDEKFIMEYFGDKVYFSYN